MEEDGNHRMGCICMTTIDSNVLQCDTQFMHPMSVATNYNVKEGKFFVDTKDIALK